MKAKQETPKTEIELPPEIVEATMKKVTDIFEYGTASTSILGAFDHSGNLNEEIFTSILQKGVMGESRSLRHSKPIKGQSLLWKKQLRQKEQVTVSFLIQGRNFDNSNTAFWNASKYGVKDSMAVPQILDGLQQDEHDAHRFNSPWFRGAAIIFNLNGLSEVPPHYEREADYRSPLPMRTFTFRGPIEHTSAGPNGHGDLCFSSEFGFSLSARIPPRRFSGIILREVLGDSDHLARIMADIYRSSPELLVPIYNPRGDLVWPRQMSYQEVQEFVKTKKQT